MSWKVIDSLDHLDQIVDLSKNKNIVLFKHSTRCSISTIAKMRLEEEWNISKDDFEKYYLDLIRYRNISNEISERFQVHHESPQILVIRNGEAIYDVSHLDISILDIESTFI